MKIDKTLITNVQLILMMSAVQINSINVYIMCINVRRDYRCNAPWQNRLNGTLKQFSAMSTAN